MNFRIAKPDEFTFKRDSDGQETIEHSGIIIGIVGASDVAFVPGVVVDGERVSRAIDKAESVGFWRMGRPKPSCLTIGVTVEVAP